MEINPNSLPNSSQENISEYADFIPEISELMIDKPAATPEAKPEEKPAAAPEEKPQDAPETAPEATPEAKPEDKPEAAPEEKPKADPEEKPAAKPKETSTIIPSDVLDAVWDEDGLLKFADSALEWKKFALENPDGGSISIDGKTQEYSEQAIKNILINADRLLSIDIPMRKEFLAKTSACEAGFKSEFPAFFEEKSPEWVGAMSALAEIPALKKRPDGLGLAFIFSLGIKEITRLRSAKKAPTATASTKPTAPLAPPPVKTTATIPVANHSTPIIKTKAKALDRVLSTGGDIDALTNYFS